MSAIDGYAVVLADGHFSGIWRVEAAARLWTNRSPAAKGEAIRPMVFADRAAGEIQVCEGLIQPTAEELLQALYKVRRCAEELLHGVEDSPGGDFKTLGSTNHADSLQEALDEYHALYFRSKP